MGIRLIIEALDFAPEDATPAERLLLVALAEKACDESRRCIYWSRSENPRDVLRRRMGVSESGVQKTLARLTKRGLDPRVPLTTDKHGRPVYAFEGRASEYVMPVLRADLLGNPLEDESQHHSAATEHEEAAPEGRLGGTTVLPLEPERQDHSDALVPLSLESPSPRASHDLVPAAHQAAVAALIAKHGSALTEQDAIDCVADAAPRAKGDLVNYVAGFPLEDIARNAARQRKGSSRRPASGAKRCSKKALLTVDGCCPEHDAAGVAAAAPAPTLSRREEQAS